MPEPTAQELTDSSPADPDISINPPDTGGDTAPPDDLDVEVTFDNPVVGGSGQDASLIPGIVQSPSENFTPGTSSQPDVTQQTGDTGEDYSELDGVTELFAESD
ncbi:hypothetical protein, partial [Endozoicomonas sp. YOMI1]|uniref:hypothetical protein n=1 Tax=Endozoicomonas sp. YOMI1 TaxID=2828739 RepID=UPI00359FF436